MALMIACQTMQQPWLKASEPGPNQMVRGKREFKLCIPVTKTTINIGSHVKILFLCIRVSLNIITAKTKDNNSSHCVSDVVN